MGVYDYGLFKLYGNKQQNKKAISDIQSLTGESGLWGPKNKAAYANMVAHPTVNGGSYQSKDVMHTTPQELWKDGFSDNYNKSLASSVVDSTVNASAESGGLGKFGYVTASDGSKIGLNKDAFATIDRGSVGYGDQYYDQPSGKTMNKNMIMPDSAAALTYQGYLDQNGGTYNKDKGMQTESEFNQDQRSQGYLDNQQFNNYAGAGLGAISTGLGVLSYFDNKAMNKKNMDLLDQQILNNQDIMATRKARASDISKYFG